MAALFTRRNQLQWLALLAVAVILPTVSLLWFMSRVIANERLVVRQKLSVLYQDKLSEATARTESILKSRLARFDRLDVTVNPYETLRLLVLEDNLQGVVIWSSAGSLVYPQSSQTTGGEAFRNGLLSEAWQEEFARQHYADALQLYDRLTAADDPVTALSAMIGKTRCLSRLNKLDAAIDECQRAAFVDLKEGDDPGLRLAVENARLLLLSLLRQSAPLNKHATVFQRTVSVLMRDLFYAGSERALLPANENFFIARKVLDALPLATLPAGESNQFARLVAAEELSITAAEALQPSVQPGIVLKTRLGDRHVYVLRHQTRNANYIMLLSDSGVASVLSGYHDTFARSEAAYRILDAAGEYVSGESNPTGQAFAVVPLPADFPGWKVELYFEGGEVFENAARRQIAVYLWTGFLVILLIVIAASFAIRAVGRQIRLNEMKNDFIATVSHELKTPIASMRVLVDTLLEGNIRDDAQARQYLHLAARENERLSRMIENFLTFSRMERNKIAFTIVDAKPALIARDAIEAIKTKYDANHCPLTVETAENVPDIQADHDAIVTVLVNLLDNACKYTTGHKQVTLRIYPENGSVCFSVSDNGIGLARKHMRRIFERFYQVDSSLARKAEGCGLGLSIVKFIVDAHKGRIDVESKPDKGSTFTVSLPVSRGNGD